MRSPVSTTCTTGWERRSRFASRPSGGTKPNSSSPITNSARSSAMGSARVSGLISSARACARCCARAAGCRARREFAATLPMSNVIAACLCFRDSAAYLHEWLLFHRVQGITRFYLYDNDSADDYLPVLAPWLRDGSVRLRKWPGLAQQRPMFDDCLARADADVEWLAFIDDDEFLFSANQI